MQGSETASPEMEVYLARRSEMEGENQPWGSIIISIIRILLDALTLETVIFLMTNSANGSMEFCSMTNGLPGQGTNGVSAFSGQYTSHFFYTIK